MRRFAGAVLALICIACGSDAIEITPGDGPLSLEDYPRYLEQVWTDIGDQLLALPDQMAESNASFSIAAAATADIYDDYVRRLDAAIPPDRFADVHTQLRDAAAALRDEVASASETGIPLGSDEAMTVAERLNTACRDIELRLSTIGEHDANCLSQ